MFRGLSTKDSFILLLENREQASPGRVATAWFRSPAAVSSFQRITVPLVYGALPSSAPVYSFPANGLFGDANTKITHLTWVAASSASGALLERGKQYINRK